MAKNLVRIDIINTCGGHCWAREEHPEGEFVYYEDYERLQKMFQETLDRVDYLEDTIQTLTEE